jgi:hypothetical protein
MSLGRDKKGRVLLATILALGCLATATTHASAVPVPSPRVALGGALEPLLLLCRCDHGSPLVVPMPETWMPTAGVRLSALLKHDDGLVVVVARDNEGSRA